MIGITKEEAVKMFARCAEVADTDEDIVAIFTNAILERAAAELGNGKSATVIGSETEWGDGWNRGVSDALDGAKRSLRTLKINTGD